MSLAPGYQPPGHLAEQLSVHHGGGVGICGGREGDRVYLAMGKSGCMYETIANLILTSRKTFPQLSLVLHILKFSCSSNNLYIMLTCGWVSESVRLLFGPLKLW